VHTTVFDAVTKQAWSGTEKAGAVAFDTATVTGVPGMTPTGSVTYSFFTNGTCAGPATNSHTVSLSGGTTPNSNSTGSMAAGSYSFQASYSGDDNYMGSTSACEPFAVASGPPPPPNNAPPAPEAPITNVTIPVTG
jgi:hypothetical protein